MDTHVPKHRAPGITPTVPGWMNYVPRHRAETAHDDALSRRIADAMTPPPAWFTAACDQYAETLKRKARELGMSW